MILFLCDWLKTCALFQGGSSFLIEKKSQKGFGCLFKMSVTNGLNCSQKMWCFTGLFQSGWSLFYWAVQLLHGRSPKGFGLFKDATDLWFELFTEDLCALRVVGHFVIDRKSPKSLGFMKEHVYALFQGSHSTIFYLWPVVWGADRTFLWFVPGRLLSCPLPWKPWGVAAREAEVQLQRRAAVGSQLVFSESRCFDWPGWYLWSVI